MGLIEKLMKNSTSKYTDTIADSKLFQQKDFAPTLVPAVNLILSGSFKGGVTYGHTIFAGESKHFKTAFLMLCIRAFFDKYEAGVCLFYDTEFGAPQDYFTTFGIPLDRVVHTPIHSVEEMTHDCMTQLEGMSEDDHVIIIVDSFGNMASNKEIEDALKGEDKTDMTRAKKLKGLFRQIIMRLNTKRVPMISSGHTYKTLEMYSKQILGGGTGLYYGANDIFFIGRSQNKNETTKTIEGYDFTINVDKSRFVREKSKVEINVTFDGGIDMWSGLMDLAKESGHIVKSDEKGKINGYIRLTSDGKLYQTEALTNHFWMTLLDDQTFVDFVEGKYKYKKGQIIEDISDDDVASDMKDA